MRRVSASGHASNFFTEGNPGTGTPATVVSASWMNIAQEEISYVIETAGLTLDQANDYDGGNDTTQLYQAILELINTGGSGVAEVAFGDSPYTAISGSKIIEVDTSGGNVVVNLPAVAGVTGQRWIVAKMTADANTVTIDGNSSETINGETTQVIEYQYTVLTVLALSSEWALV